LKTNAFIWLAWLCSVATGFAAQLPGEQLLPAETIFMATVKDWNDATNAFWKSSLGRLWNDEAMRATRAKFNTRLTNEFAQPLDRELKIKASDYTELVNGQVTLALTKAEKPGKWFGFLLLIDAKDKADLLKTNLADLQKKWTDSGKKIRTEKVRDMEFTAYQFTQATLQKLARKMTGKPEDAAPDPEAETNRIDLLVGQAQSLLLVGTQARDLEKVLAKQSGGAPGTLADQPVFQANYNALFRDALGFAWLDFKPIFELWTAPEAGAAAAPTARFANLTAQKVLPALGLGDLRSIAFKVTMPPEGYNAELFLTVPEAARQGLVKALAPPAKDASPPPFIPADAVQFKRKRIDLQQGWNAFESALVKIDPAVAGVVQLMLGAAGKDRDAAFDLKKSLIESAGDDFISYDKPAKSTNPPPSISLIGSRNPEQFLNGVKVVMRMLPEPIGTTALAEREFQGRKIYTMTYAPGSQLVLSANASYVAISSEPALVEEFLRSADAPPKPLRDLPGLADAAQKIGGFNTGWFSYENQIETTRSKIEQAKANPDHEPVASSPLALNPLEGELPEMMDWIDAPSLPPFDRIAKYFYLFLTTGTTTVEGISFKFSAPTPPGLK
jgi:hypothetical protein